MGNQARDVQNTPAPRQEAQQQVAVVQLSDANLVLGLSLQLSCNGNFHNCFLTCVSVGAHGQVHAERYIASL